MRSSRCAVCGIYDARHLFVKGVITVVRCSACHHVFLRDPDLEYGYEKFEKEYQERRPFDPLTTVRFAELLRQLEPYRSTGRLLEVGYGNAQFLVVARDFGWQVSGTELSKRAHLHARELELDVFLGDLLEAKFPTNSFDIVLMQEVIEHLSAPVEYLTEVWKVLRPGGVMYLTTPNFKSLNRLLLGSRWSIFTRVHLQYFSPCSLRLALQRAGFEGSLIASKNINPLELLRQLHLTGHAQSSQSSTAAFRQVVESLWWARVLKELVNVVLRCVRLGDTLCVFARKTRSIGFIHGPEAS